MNNKILADRANIERYIPQRTPMVMIHDLIEAEQDYAISILDIMPENIFIVDGYFSEPGLVENIAQTAAAHAGYQYGKHNVPVPIGFIAAIKNLEVFQLPKVGSCVTTTVRVTNKILDVTIIEGKVEQNSVTLCSCEMRIFIKQ
jgi:predicted hotdog family 3-hydroxylacyl-ACP dehydratase